MLFKVLNWDGTPCHGGAGKWSLPTKTESGWQPSEWMPPIEGELIPCWNGYHLCRPSDLICWLGPVIWRAEYRGEIRAVDGIEGKVVVREARLLSRLETWNERTARLFACDCSEHVLSLFGFGAVYSDDERPRKAIEVARRFANGEATQDELTVAEAAVRDAARDAGVAVRSSWVVAEAAAVVAAKATTRAAARDAESKWQTQRLLEYLEIEP